MGPIDRAFEHEWPDLARRLHSLLATKHIPFEKREDIVQETGLRLFRMWDDVDPERPVWALAVTIALNLVRDDARRRPGREILGAVPDLPAAFDTERSGLARIELRRVEAALNKMAPAHRSVLLAEVGDDHDGSGRGPNAVKMLRMRARRRLSSLLDTASAGLVAAGFRLRRVLRVDFPFVAVRNASGDAGAAQTAAGLLAAVAFLSLAPHAVDGWVGADGTTIRPPGTNLGALAAGGGGESSSTAVTAGHRTSIATSNHHGAAARRGYRDGRDRPWRGPLHIPVGPDGYLEGGAEVGVFGMGARVGERDERPPACLSGMPVETLVPACDAAETSGQDPDGVHVRVHTRVKVGPVVVHTQAEI